MAVGEPVEAFCGWLCGEYRADGSLERIAVLSGPEAGGAEAAVRLHVTPRSYYEARVDLTRSEVQVGFATESRVTNEAAEQMVLDNGGDLSDLLGDELSELGAEPLPMEHFWDRPAFRYVVRLPLETTETLGSPILRSTVGAVLKASRTLFQDAVDGS